MNKTAIKNFSIWARNKLIEDITYRAGLIGVSEKGIAQPLSQSTKDLQFFDIGTKDYAQVAGKEIEQRNGLVKAIKEKERDLKYADAFKAVIEEIAYTWFNRLVAIRFMEVNDYLPSCVRVLSSENPAKNEPDFVTTPFDTDLEFTSAEQDRIMQLKDQNKLDELFRMLFIKQCNKLNEILPEMFEQTSDYTELLLSISFTDNDGIVYHLTHDIPEQDFNVESKDENGNSIGQVEIIGWLYQYYNTALNEQVYDGKLSKSRIPKELLPAATTIYTPDWAIQYMVQNSLGKLWRELRPDDNSSDSWKYYLNDAEQSNIVKDKLESIQQNNSGQQLEDIRFIDPCMGSGHILVYVFDVFMQLYESQGYTQRDAASLIIKNNLYGLDIDNRAAQLAYFAVMMKARQYDRRIFDRGIQPNVYAIRESNNIDAYAVEYFSKGNKKLRTDLETILIEMRDAKEYGSILRVSAVDFDAMFDRIYEIQEEIDLYREIVLLEVLPLLRVAKALAQQYDVVVTNPPYLGSTRFSPKLDKYVKDNYPEVKSDLSMVMHNRALTGFAKLNGFVAFITTSSWMFLSSFEKMRRSMFETACIYSVVDFGTELFEGKVGHNPIVAWVNRKCNIDYRMTAVRLVDYCYSRRDEKEPELAKARNRHYATQSSFDKIPGSPIVYWASPQFLNNFSIGETLKKKGDTRQGMATSDNNRFLRLWYEVSYEKMGLNCASADQALAIKKKWYPYNKGGEFRKWYGNIDYTVNYENDGYEVKEYASSLYKTPSRTIKSMSEYFKPCLSWSKISSGSIAFRYYPKGFVFDVAGCCIFYKDEETMFYDFGFINSVVSKSILAAISPTLNYEAGHIASLPVIREKAVYGEVVRLVKNNIEVAKSDWDSFENSWDFQKHPLVQPVHCIVDAYKIWADNCLSRFKQLKDNEEKLNSIFIDIYGLQDELPSEIVDKDVTVRKADVSRDIRSLISYAVGCMFGRYTLDAEGLAYAGDKWDDSKYRTFIPDKDNCIPITDESYFEDDIVGRFCQWLRTVYGADTLEDNLDFIAQALGNKGATSREVIRNYFLNDFIKDHIKTYQKRPIYWLFDSGKQNGFKALVYMHRWDADTVGNLRVEYLHKMQHTYEREIQRMQETIDDGRDAREVSKATKRKDKLQKQLKETKDYDAKLAHIALSRIEIDLDDGVKVNYEKVQTGRDGKKMQILTKI